MTYYPDLAVAGAADTVGAFARLAVRNGVRRLVLLSGRGEEGALLGEQAVRDSGADWTILRSAWFSQNFNEGFFLDQVSSGEVALPAGDVKEPFLDADDIADVAVAALTKDGHMGQLYELTGPRLMTFAEAVEEIARAIRPGDPVRPDLPRSSSSPSSSSTSVPAEFVSLMSYLFTEVLDGRNSSPGGRRAARIGSGAAGLQRLRKAGRRHRRLGRGGAGSVRSAMPFFETSDGTSLHYEDGGCGRPVVLVASAWLSSRMWEYQVPHLVGRGLRCVAYDRRGHGRSDSPWDGYDYDTLAEDLAALLEHLDLRGVTLVAHSAGGGEVVRYLTRHGAGRVARIALVSATTPFPMKTRDNPDGVDRALMEADLAARTADRPRWLADNADGFFGVGLPGVSVSPELAQFMIRQMPGLLGAGRGRVLPHRLHHRPAPRAAEADRPDPDRPRRPGSCRRPSTSAAARPPASCRSSKLIVYENAAHGLFVTHAKRLNADLVEFIGA